MPPGRWTDAVLRQLSDAKIAWFPVNLSISSPVHAENRRQLLQDSFFGPLHRLH